MWIMALTKNNLTAEHMYQFVPSDLAAFPLTQHHYWLPPVVEGSVSDVQKLNASYWSSVQTCCISTLTDTNNERYLKFIVPETNVGTLLAMTVLIGKAFQVMG